MDTVNEMGSVTVKKELMINIKNILDVVIPRTNWKSEEMLPVGMIVKQVTDIVNSPSREEAVEPTTMDTVNDLGSVDVKKELMINIKSIFDVVIPRTNWKSEEMLPVGTIVKQVTDIVNSPSREEDDVEPTTDGEISS